MHSRLSVNIYMSNPETGPELIPNEGVFLVVEGLIDSRDFGEAGSAAFAWKLCRWLLDTYETGGGSISTRTEGFEGEELPQELQKLVLYDWQGELHIGHENSASIKRHNEYIEHPPYIPKWETIGVLPTFQERIDAALSDPEIRDRIVPASVEVIQGVQVGFRPLYTRGWGLDFVLSSWGVNVYPYGESGKTITPTRFVQENLDREDLFCELACRVGLLAAKYESVTHDYRSSVSRGVGEEQITKLYRWLDGSEAVPIIIDEDYNMRSGNTIESMIAQTVKDKMDDDPDDTK